MVQRLLNQLHHAVVAPSCLRRSRKLRLHAHALVWCAVSRAQSPGPLHNTHLLNVGLLQLLSASEGLPLWDRAATP